MIDPIEQFNIHKLFTIGHIGNQEIAFTNSSAYMLGSVALISLLMIGGVAGKQLVPGRIQSIAEISYEFVANTIRSTAGKEGMKFFPLIFSLFMFVTVSNMIGVIPYNFTVASHLIVTAALAVLVFLTVLIYGFYKNGLKFFKLFVPSGIPIFILPLVVFIEVFSFFLRPISHSVRLFANMLAGHIALAVFASFIPLLAGLVIAGYFGAVLPLGMVIALTALELLVAFLQAYVFTILTVIYINDAIHPGPCLVFSRTLGLSSKSASLTNLKKEFVSWIRLPRSTLALVLPALAWVAPARAWASSSATISPLRCGILRPLRASSAT